MAGCGYVCPKCEGTGFLAETLEVCDWCQKPAEKIVTITYEEWIKTVHESSCCSDIGQTSEHKSTNITPN
jgi:hypothetical protein